MLDCAALLFAALRSAHLTYMLSGAHGYVIRNLYLHRFNVVSIADQSNRVASLLMKGNRGMSMESIEKIQEQLKTNKLGPGTQNQYTKCLFIAEHFLLGWPESFDNFFL